jgi:Domain of Unknown Function (DUF1080)
MFAPLALVLLAPATDFTPLFNGKDLAGWVNVNCAPGTFYVKDNEIVTTGSPTGFLRTDRQYENFVLEFEWMHTREKGMANSGLFVWGDPLPAVGTPYTRGIEVQVLINYKPADGWATSHGDIFSIWGAKCVPDRPHPKGLERCLPIEDRVKGAGEWNHYRVTANDGVVKLAVNGKEMSGVSKCDPRKGYLALESEGSECRFRNIKIKELATTNPTPEQAAKLAEGHVSLFDGLTLAGWGFWVPPGYTSDQGWKAGGGVLKAVGTNFLESKRSFGACELVFDWKLPEKSDRRACVVQVGGHKIDVKLPDGQKPGGWHRHVMKSESAGQIQFLPAAGLEVMNVFVREDQGK